MMRYLLPVAAALVMTSSFAFAEVGDMGPTSKKVITRTSPDGMASKKVIIKRHADGLASKKVVIKRHDDGFGSRTVVRHGFYGSSMPDRPVVRRDVIIR